MVNVSCSAMCGGTIFIVRGSSTAPFPFIAFSNLLMRFGKCTRDEAVACFSFVQCSFCRANNAPWHWTIQKIYDWFHAIQNVGHVVHFYSTVCTVHWNYRHAPTILWFTLSNWRTVLYTVGRSAERRNLGIEAPRVSVLLYFQINRAVQTFPNNFCIGERYQIDKQTIVPFQLSQPSLSQLFWNKCTTSDTYYWEL